MVRLRSSSVAKQRRRAVTDTYVYDVFGTITSHSGPSRSYWLFTGEQLDQTTGDTGYYFLRARYYDPALGRFISRDPLLFDQRYAYAGSNPLLSVDPSGLCRLSGFLTCLKDHAVAVAVEAVQDAGTAIGSGAQAVASAVADGYKLTYELESANASGSIELARSIEQLIADNPNCAVIIVFAATVAVVAIVAEVPTIVVVYEIGGSALVEGIYTCA